MWKMNEICEFLKPIMLSSATAFASATNVIAWRKSADVTKHAFEGTIIIS